MAVVTEEQILDALGDVIEPQLRKDIVSLGMVKHIAIDGQKVSFEVVLTTPDSPFKKEIEDFARQTVVKIKGVKDVEIVFSLNVPRSVADPNRSSIMPGVKNVIAVASGKGGVGKTTISVNLAVALAEAGAAVGIMDADIYGPNVPIMMGASGSPETTMDNKMKPRVNHRVKLISMGLLADQNTPMIWRGPIVSRVTQEFMSRVDWGDLDYLIMDLPPGTGDIQLTISQSAPLTGAVIVTTPQDVALEDVRRGILMFQKVNIPILGIIENMSYFACPHCGERTEIFDHGGGKVAGEKFDVPFLGEVPLDPEIRIGSDIGTPVVKLHPASPQTEAFRKIAGALAARIGVIGMGEPPEGSSGGWGGRLMQKIRGN